MSKEENYFLISDPIEIIFDSEEIELWEVSLLNLSIHRIINKVALETLRNELDDKLLDELLFKEESRTLPRHNKIPRLITTRIKSVNNGSIHQIIELGSTLEHLIANREFVSGVLGSLSVNVITAIYNVNVKNVRTFLKKDGKRIDLSNDSNQSSSISSNIANLSSQMTKPKKKHTKFKLKFKVKNLELLIELEKNKE